MRLLCVETSATVRKMVDLMLATTGIDIDFAETGDQAVEAYQVTEYDAVLMDMDMPVKSGIQTAKEIRQMEDGFMLDYTPILFLAGAADEERLQHARAAGGDGHLVKPFTSEGLIGAIDRVLRTSRPCGFGMQSAAR